MFKKHYMYYKEKDIKDCFIIYQCNKIAILGKQFDNSNENKKLTEWPGNVNQFCKDNNIDYYFTYSVNGVFSQDGRRGIPEEEVRKFFRVQKFNKSFETHLT